MNKIVSIKIIKKLTLETHFDLSGSAKLVQKIIQVHFLEPLDYKGSEIRYANLVILLEKTKIKGTDDSYTKHIMIRQLLYFNVITDYPSSITVLSGGNPLFDLVMPDLQRFFKASVILEDF